MIFNVKSLKTVMDLVRTDEKWAPKDGVTHCDSNCFQVAEKLGVGDIWAPLNDASAMANDMIAHMDAHPDKFFKFSDHMKAWQLAAEGSLVFAARREAGHGHICPVYPSVGMVTSGHWRAQVPYCSNVGIRNEVMGVNYAFGGLVQPDYYAVK